MGLKRNGSTRRWRRVRAHVLERDGWRCTVCGAPAVEVDHLIPVRDGGSDHPRNLRSVCTAHNPRSFTDRRF
jgi:5-methylcytosine-specific restriction endonuclease McrA